MSKSACMYSKAEGNMEILNVLLNFDNAGLLERFDMIQTWMKLSFFSSWNDMMHKTSEECKPKISDEIFILK